MRPARAADEQALSQHHAVDGGVPSATASARKQGFLRLEGLSKHFGGHAAVDRMDLAVDEGELVAFLGPSGCGKTTTLRMIAGFIESDAGAIYIDDKRIDNLPSRLRGTAMVFQDYALFPHMTAFDNVAFGLRMRKVGKSEIRRRVEAALDFVRLPSAGDKYPRELSGGMKQRVALARAIVVEPRMLLLDEPLSNLDAKLRKQLRVELRELHERIGITTVFVTHDLEEAFYLADRVAVMHNGRVEQFGSPKEVYAKPATPFVADFVGHTNVIRGELHPGADGRGRFHGAGLEIVTEAAASAVSEGIYAVPPHRICLSTGDERPSVENAFRGTIHMTAYLGPVSNIHVDVDGMRFQCDIPEGGADPERLREGQPVWVSWKSGDGEYVPS